MGLQREKPQETFAQLGDLHMSTKRGVCPKTAEKVGLNPDDITSYRLQTIENKGLDDLLDYWKQTLDAVQIEAGNLSIEGQHSEIILSRQQTVLNLPRTSVATNGERSYQQSAKASNSFDPKFQESQIL